jgi:hypothetical protein
VILIKKSLSGILIKESFFGILRKESLSWFLWKPCWTQGNPVLGPFDGNPVFDPLEESPGLILLRELLPGPSRENPGLGTSERKPCPVFL